MATQLDEALGAGVTYGSGALAVMLGNLTDAVPILAAYLGLLLILIRIAYEALRLTRAWKDKRDVKSND